jgi:hypothetical protein
VSDQPTPPFVGPGRRFEPPARDGEVEPPAAEAEPEPTDAVAHAQPVNAGVTVFDAAPAVDEVTAGVTRSEDPPPFPPRNIQQPQRRLPPRVQYQQRRPTMVPPDSTAVGPHATQTLSPSLDAEATGEPVAVEGDAQVDQAAQRLIVIKTEKLVGWLTIALDENSRLHRELLDAHADIDWLRRENQQLRDAMASNRPRLVRAVVGVVATFLIGYGGSVAGNVTTNSLLDAKNERPAAATAADFVRECRELEALIPPTAPSPVTPLADNA